MHQQDEHWWSAECEDGNGKIPLKKVRSVMGKILLLSWPDRLRYCPYCSREHYIVGLEIDVAIFTPAELSRIENMLEPVMDTKPPRL